MSQNVTNNWFQKINTDSSFQDKSSQMRSVGVNGSTFQSFLSQQVKKTNPVTTPKGNDAYAEKTNGKIMKRPETTAAKLSVKIPEKTNNTDAEVKTNSSSGRTEKMQSKEAAGSSTQKVNGQATDENAVSMETESEDAVKEISVADLSPELIQLIQSLPTEVIEQLPEELKALLSEVSEKLQMLTVPTDAKSKMEMILETAKGMEAKLENTNYDAKAIKLDVVQAVKTLVSELKALQGVNPETVKSFESILNQLGEGIQLTEVLKADKSATEVSSASQTQTQVQTDAVSETKTADNTNLNNSKGGESKSSFESAFEGKKGIANTQENVEVKVTQETKVNSENVIREFTAKTETASIAFGKQEMTNQGVKNAMHTNIMDQIINSPKLQIKQTEQGAMMTLKLNPEVLGNVEIKMEIVKGVLQAEINVENMIVKGAIESNLSDLKNALSDKGYQVEALNVSVGQGKEGEQAREQRHQQNTGSRESVFTAEELEAINSSYGFETVVNDTRIDYLG